MIPDSLVLLFLKRSREIKVLQLTVDVLSGLKVNFLDDINTKTKNVK